MLLLLSGSCTGFWAAVFFLGSEETMARMVQADGLLKIFALRWLGFAAFGGLCAPGLGLLSWAGRALGLGHGWARPKQVFRLALVLQLVWALLGCLVFAYAAGTAG
ncbi:hypothetical protein [Hymenobacter edaphi]|uniref:Uncharacterized protein n=1 Tax=Hymenobacter edaphi TaxID=2211146 RepID=A0A328BM09_9BACT|nr:hypothetical protein [Hymenobacter edaphi]RAK67016.1 hypothetical protein DLM85_12510 [Hymenobacter edaphi]